LFLDFVCLTDVNAEVGQATLEGFQKTYGKDNAIFSRCNVVNEADFTGVFESIKSKYGKVDILVNNAGIIEEKNWRRTIDVNLVGMMQGTYLGIENMSKEHGGDGGVIINVASSAGLQPVFFSPAYCASKFGIIGFTRSWADNPSNAHNGLRFCCLCPAFTETNMMNISENSTLSIEATKKFIEYVGVNKISTVAEGFMDLLTDETNNGAVMAVTAREGIQYKIRK
ncbi:15-hydroxyprostaglandin dehydrogenase [NAD(+)], partial [Patella vulgata]|uniref:15-hydroxyprostaglandin dehydrogenase [NAD(+)] n=1 Tax=Patella vulgata TaxID=6465 RepID=UPI0024A8E4E0